MKEFVILVDQFNNQIGVEEKIKAHELALLHRAFSVLIFNKDGELLIHQRAAEKYHCPWLWSNTVCSHPRPWEDTEQAAHRRLWEEMGFDCQLSFIDHIVYKAEFDNGLTEYEYDLIFMWVVDTITVKPNPEEIQNYKWIWLAELQQDMQKNPSLYTPWFSLVLQKYLQK